MIRHCRFTGNGGGAPDGHEGHDLEYGGTEEVLVVESPHPDDAVVPVEILGGAALGGLLGLALVSGCNT